MIEVSVDSPEDADTDFSPQTVRFTYVCGKRSVTLSWNQTSTVVTNLKEISNQGTSSEGTYSGV